MMDTENRPEQPINRVYQITAVLLLIGCQLVYMSLYFQFRSTLQPYDSFTRYGWPLLAILLIGALIYRLPFRLVFAGEMFAGVGYAMLYYIAQSVSRWPWPWGGIVVLVSPAMLLFGGILVFRRFRPFDQRTVEFLGATCILTFNSLLMPV